MEIFETSSDPECTEGTLCLPIEITYGVRTQWGWEKTLRREIGILDGGQVGQKSQRCYIAQEVVSFQYGLHAEKVRQGLSVEGPD